jgi:hypothetical protein
MEPLQVAYQLEFDRAFLLALDVPLVALDMEA